MQESTATPIPPSSPNSRAGTELVGSEGPLETAPRIESGAAAVRAARCRACRAKRCSMSAAAAAFCRSPWRGPAPRCWASTWRRPCSTSPNCTPSRRKSRGAIRAVAAEDLARERPAAFDLVTCMEMLEHVPDPAATLGPWPQLVKPGGDVDRVHLEPQSAGLRGGHRRRGIHRPRAAARHPRVPEIHPAVGTRRWGREAGLELRDLTGIAYNPLTRSFRLSPTPSELPGAFRRCGRRN
jgi:SAM-dependent methyltransferase